MSLQRTVPLGINAQDFTETESCVSNKYDTNVIFCRSGLLIFKLIRDTQLSQDRKQCFLHKVNINETNTNTQLWRFRFIGFPCANLKLKGNLVKKSGNFTQHNNPVLKISVNSTGLCTPPLCWKPIAKHLFYRALEQPSRLAGGVPLGDTVLGAGGPSLYNFFLVFSLYRFVCLRQDFSIWLFSNLLCRSCWPRISKKSTCLCLLVKVCTITPGLMKYEDREIECSDMALATYPLGALKLQLG